MIKFNLQYKIFGFFKRSHILNQILQDLMSFNIEIQKLWKISQDHLINK